MIISRTPFRISFLGGGTDYPAWYREHGGAVIATTIDKYCYLTCRYLPPFFEHRYRIVYSKIENAESLEAIQHPAVREILKHLELTRGVEIHHLGDLPARSGMGSSSSFTVGLLHALYALQGRMVSKHQLAMDGIHVEQNLLRETVGSQDQVLAAYGGLSHVRFLASGEISVRPIIMRPERIAELNSHVMLIYTGIVRTASEVANTYVNGIEKQRRQLRIISDLVKEGLALLSGERDIANFGELLHEAWQVKRNLSQQRLQRPHRRHVRRRHCRGGRGRQTAGGRRRGLHAALRSARSAGGRQAEAAGADSRPLQFRVAGQPDHLPRSGEGLLERRNGAGRSSRRSLSGACRRLPGREMSRLSRVWVGNAGNCKVGRAYRV